MTVKRLKYIGIFAVVLLVGICLSLHFKANATVDFSGKVQDVHLTENRNAEFTIVGLGGESKYTVVCDNNTKVVLYKNKDRIELADIEVGDIVDGNYRLFSKNKAKNITVVKPQNQ